MAKNKKKPGQIDPAHLQAFCRDLAGATEKTQQDLEWLETELTKGVEADFEKTEKVLDLCEDRLWAVEAKKYGVELESFKENASLYRRGFTKYDLEGEDFDLDRYDDLTYKPKLGVRDQLSLVEDSGCGYHFDQVYRLFSNKDLKVNVYRMMLDNLRPEQLHLLHQMSTPVVLITPAGSLAEKIEVINRNKVAQQEDINLPGAGNDLIDYKKVKVQPRNVLSIVELDDLTDLLDPASPMHNQFYVKLAKAAPKSLEKKYQYYQEKYSRYGAEIMGVHEYLFLTEMGLCKSANECSANNPFGCVIDFPPGSKKNNTVFNLSDFSDDTKGYGFGRFDYSETRRKYRVLLNAFNPGRPNDDVQFRPSIRICEF